MRTHSPVRSAAVIAVHGLSSPVEPLERLIEHVGASVLSVGSTRPWAPDLQGWSDEITKAHLLQDGDATHLVAHSLGAVPALRAATFATNPQILLLNPFLAHRWAVESMQTLDPTHITVVVGEHDVVTRKQGVVFAEKFGANLIRVPGLSHSGFLPGFMDLWSSPVSFAERAVNRALGRRGETLTRDEQFRVVSRIVSDYLGFRP